MELAFYWEGGQCGMISNGNKASQLQCENLAAAGNCFAAGMAMKVSCKLPCHCVQYSRYVSLCGTLSNNPSRTSKMDNYEFRASYQLYLCRICIALHV